MGYVSKRGKRPMELASKAAHGYVIKDSTVQAFLAKCDLPKRAERITFAECQLIPFTPSHDNPIRHIIAVDSGYTEVAVQTEFPSATVCFFQFGALIFSIEDLDNLDEQPFIDPENIAKLKRIQRLKLTIPVRNVTLQDESTVTNSVRRAVYDFLCQDLDDGRLIDSLRWLIFQEYGVPQQQWILASCPACRNTEIPLRYADMSRDCTFRCGSCGGEIYLTDVLRLHEAIDDELGAGGIIGYLTTALEQIILVHLIRLILKTKPALLKQVLFIKDGPLAFFGQTANLYKPMRALVNFLFANHELFLAGLEKSGAFVEHADEIASNLPDGSVLILNNDYIYKYIVPGKADPGNPYGRTTYYGNKLIFKTTEGRMYVVSLPTKEVMVSPSEHDLRNMNAILSNIQKLKCDMYDDALLPVALVNKLVSLANHPSSRILQKFAIEAIHR
jgi:hypothetical protein